MPDTVVRGRGLVVGGPEGYVTASACRDCHAEQYASWHASFHRTMTQPANRESVAADFDGAVLETQTERFTLGRDGDDHWVTIEDLDELARWRPELGQPRPASVRARLAMVTGAHHMQVFWLPALVGNGGIGFPFTWLIADRRWAPRHSVFIRNPAAEPPVETWNTSCIRCHVTAGQPRPRAEQGVFETRIGDYGIACEACHGPGEAHTRSMRDREALRHSATPPTTPAATNLAIVHPAKIGHVRSAQVCGQCHSMKWFDRQEGWLEHGFRYRPGDNLESTTPVIRPGRLAEQPWLHGIAREHPTLFDEFFWSDGMIRVAGREFNGLRESACFERGQMSCLSCHALHDYASPDDQLRSDQMGDTACLSCHDPARFQAPQHSHHREGSTGSACLNCHMPHTTYALLKAVRQHQIDSPNLASTLATGRPNACNLCHLDRSLRWSAEHLNAWFGQPMPQSPGGDADGEIAAGVEWLLAGDAGQRALLAWHFGWAPALNASAPDEDWPVSLLARLLDDPYPAVRYIASRSIRARAAFVGLDCDFLGNPSLWDAARREVHSRARPSRSVDPVRRKLLLLGSDGGADNPAIERVVARRNNRPVHLRE